jgi:GcrA cell cycle regulator
MSLTYLENRHNKFDSPWTPERVELLKQLWTEGYSASQIADKFKHTTFTRCSVIGKARRLKLEPRAPRQPRRHKANGGVPKPPTPPPRPRPPEPPPPPQPAAPRMRALTFFRLKPNHCRWPLGSWFEPARLFCGADKDAGEIYCPFHRRMARVRT